MSSTIPSTALWSEIAELPTASDDIGTHRDGVYTSMWAGHCARMGLPVPARIRSMTTSPEIINRFYTAFAERDHVTMASCYAEDAVFSDPVFPELHGAEIAAMWHMLCDQGTDLVVTHSAVEADDRAGTAHWEPVYTFGPSGRTVHNIIDATFDFEDGKIIRHRDHFDLWRWMRMALGAPGVFIGWTGAAKAKVRGQAARSLERFIETHPEYQ